MHEARENTAIERKADATNLHVARNDTPNTPAGHSRKEYPYVLTSLERACTSIIEVG